MGIADVNWKNIQNLTYDKTSLRLLKYADDSGIWADEVGPASISSSDAGSSITVTRTKTYSPNGFLGTLHHGAMLYFHDEVTGKIDNLKPAYSVDNYEVKVTVTGTGSASSGGINWSDSDFGVTGNPSAMPTFTFVPMGDGELRLENEQAEGSGIMLRRINWKVYGYWKSSDGRSYTIEGLNIPTNQMKEYVLGINQFTSSGNKTISGTYGLPIKNLGMCWGNWTFDIDTVWSTSAYRAPAGISCSITFNNKTDGTWEIDQGSVYYSGTNTHGTLNGNSISGSSKTWTSMTNQYWIRLVTFQAQLVMTMSNGSIVNLGNISVDQENAGPEEDTTTTTTTT